MKHRRLDLDKTSTGEKLPNLLDRQNARAEDLLDLGIGDEVQITLPITGLNVGQSMPLFRERPEGLHEELNPLGEQGQFMGFRSKDLSF